MTDNVVMMQFGHLSLSRITYHCDLQRATGLVIPLGVIAELAVGPVRTLGLIALKTLEEKDLAPVGRMVRNKLSSPFEFLKPDFDWAWDKIETEKIEAGRVLNLLAARYTNSIFFSAPNEQRVRTTAGSALAQMRQRRDEEFYSMFDDLMEHPIIPPSKDISELEPDLAA